MTKSLLEMIRGAGWPGVITLAFAIGVAAGGVALRLWSRSWKLCVVLAIIVCLGVLLEYNATLSAVQLLSAPGPSLPPPREIPPLFEHWAICGALLGVIAAPLLLVLCALGIRPRPKEPAGQDPAASAGEPKEGQTGPHER